MLGELCGGFALAAAGWRIAAGGVGSGDKRLENEAGDCGWGLRLESETLVRLDGKGRREIDYLRPLVLGEAPLDI